MSQDTLLDVQGMSCASCVRHVTAALAIDGVDRVDVQLRDHRVIVRHDAARAPVRALVRALEDAGYVARDLALNAETASTAPRR